MKYRRLTIQELKELEKEFILYLSSQSISSDLWEEMKTKQPVRADTYIEAFSDFILEDVLTKIEYLEHKHPKELHLYKCEKDQILLIGLVIRGDTAFDFTQNNSPQQMMEQIQLSAAKVHFFQAERKYRNERNVDIYHLLESGALISRDGKLYKDLEKLRKTE